MCEYLTSIWVWESLLGHLWGTVDNVGNALDMVIFCVILWMYQNFPSLKYCWFIHTFLCISNQYPDPNYAYLHAVCWRLALGNALMDHVDPLTEDCFFGMIGALLEGLPVELIGLVSCYEFWQNRPWGVLTQYKSCASWVHGRNSQPAMQCEMVSETLQ